MISWRMTAAWVAALVVATVLAWQIVGLADSQVGDTPVAVAPSLTTTTDGAVPTTEPSTSTSTADTKATTTTTPGASTSSSSRAGSSSTDTSSPGSPTSSSTSASSTTASEQWSLRTVTTSGGVVVVRYRTGEVELKAATPAPGFSVEVDDAGPPRVRVEFESESAEIRVEARWDNGSLDIDVDD